LDDRPSPDCVQNVVAAAPGIVKVEGRWLTANEVNGWPIGPIPLAYEIRYRGAQESHIGASLLIQRVSDGEYLFSQDLLGPEAPPQEDVDATRRAMRYIEEHVASQCRMKALPSMITEHCQAVECGALDALPTQPQTSDLM
jgi:hypothetical protein